MRYIGIVYMTKLKKMNVNTMKIRIQIKYDKYFLYYKVLYTINALQNFKLLIYNDLQNG